MPHQGRGRSKKGRGRNKSTDMAFRQELVEAETCAMNALLETVVLNSVDPYPSRMIIQQESAAAKVCATYELLENILSSVDNCSHVISLRRVNTAFQSVIDTSPTILQCFQIPIWTADPVEVAQHDIPRLLEERSVLDKRQEIEHPLRSVKLFIAPPWTYIDFSDDLGWRTVWHLNAGVMFGCRRSQKPIWQSLRVGTRQTTEVLMYATWPRKMALHAAHKIVSETGITLGDIYDVASRYKADPTGYISLETSFDFAGRSIENPLAAVLPRIYLRDGNLKLCS